MAMLVVLLYLLKEIMKYSVTTQNSWPAMFVTGFAAYILYMVCFFCDKYHLI